MRTISRFTILAAGAMLFLTACGGKEKGSSDSAAEKPVAAVSAESGNADGKDLWKWENNKLVSTTGLPLVVDFSATWCPPCQKMKPIFENMAGLRRSEVTMVSIDVDENPEIAGAFGIQSIPTVVFITPDGTVRNRIVGFATEADLDTAVNNFLSE